jgi:hypothetical protein
MPPCPPPPKCAYGARKFFLDLALVPERLLTTLVLAPTVSAQ